MQTTSNQRKNLVKTERFGFVLCVKCFKEVKCFSGEVQTQEKNVNLLFLFEQSPEKQLLFTSGTKYRCLY